jgi:hypothetical protein
VGHVLASVLAGVRERGPQLNALVTLGALVILAAPFTAFIAWDARRDQLDSKSGVIGCLLLPVGVLASLVLVALLTGRA